MYVVYACEICIITKALLIVLKGYKGALYLWYM